MYSGQFQKCPKAEQCDYAPRSCEYCTLAVHAVCNFASYPHSIEHSDHVAYIQHTYAPPNHKPAGNSHFKSLQKDVHLQLPILAIE
jgi:hypothetical protein